MLVIIGYLFSSNSCNNILVAPVIIGDCVFDIGDTGIYSYWFISLFGGFNPMEPILSNQPTILSYLGK